MVEEGGDRSASALARWEATNTAMHDGMAIRFVGDVNVDFVRSMIPHHMGAVEMCGVLVEELC